MMFENLHMIIWYPEYLEWMFRAIFFVRLQIPDGYCLVWASYANFLQTIIK